MSQAISTSALAAGTRPPTTVSSVSPILTWLNTEPPFWARPVMSTTLPARPSTWAAMARIEATVVTPVPPTPVKMIRRTPWKSSNTGSGVDSAVRAGAFLALALSAPSRVMNDGQKPSTQL
jgi:hypothetical protein